MYMSTERSTPRSPSSSSSSDMTDLSMLQLSDSFFPTGMYTMSSGLEAIFYSGRKKMDAAELRDLIKIYLEQQIGPADCTALGNAYKHASASNLTLLLEVDSTIVAMRLVQEIRSASIRSGTQLIKCIHSFVKNNKILADYANAIAAGQAAGPYPVALGVAANALAIPKHKAGIMLLYSFSVSIIAAALRLGMLKHLDGQRIIDELKPTIAKTVGTFIDRPLDGIWQFAPQIDIIQITHERMSSKMFIT
jgi:urease accessory protein